MADGALHTEDRELVLSHVQRLSGMEERVIGLQQGLKQILDGIGELRGDIRSLERSRDVLAGKADQSAVTRVLLVSLVGLAVSVTSVLIGLFR